MQSLLKLAELAKSYFAPEASLEILEKTLPSFGPTNLDKNVSVVSLMCVFLPTDRVPSSPSNMLSKFSQHMDVDSSETESRPFFWIPIIFSLWALVNNSQSFDAAIFDLIGSLAEDQVGTPNYVKWNESHVCRIFSAIMDHLQLPVGSASTSGTNTGGGGRAAAEAAASGGSGSGAAVVSALAGSFTGVNLSSQGSQDFYESVRRNKFEMAAKFVINTIYNETDVAPKTNTLKHLKDLILAIESFFHPSNQ
ncbi:hypothetical protein HK096_001726, partial [Nowakowskiella sp. JEL0078]